ncbi:hypothetical protein [Winogradskyella sp.]|uniref:hypothetical protein n=1 Tax=Winogradskyella sp. TaxID=1883156 RepID=UPI00261BB108|nr:hypothetical protein [uncultured Winogradskyella sp.]
MKNKNMLASISFFSIGYISMAQGAMPPPPSPPPPYGLPIDGGIVLLFIIAFSFGIYKAVKISKKAA